MTQADKETAATRILADWVVMEVNASHRASIQAARTTAGLEGIALARSYDKAYDEAYGREMVRQIVERM